MEPTGSATDVDDYERRFAVYVMAAGAVCSTTILAFVSMTEAAPLVVPGAVVASVGCVGGLALARAQRWQLGVRIMLWSCALAIGPSAAAEPSGEAALSAGLSWLLLGVFASLVLRPRELLVLGTACTLGTAALVAWVHHLGIATHLQPGGILAVVFVAAGYATLGQIAGYFRHSLKRTGLAEQAAREALEARGQFMATMSHELRTPLNAVIGYSELLMDELEGESAHEDLHRIHWSANILLGHINAILDLSKLEAGQMGITIEPVGLAALVESVVDQHRPLMAENGNDCLVDIENALTLRTDRLKLLQILTNLVTNANKFTSEGRITIRARPDRNGVGIEISDTGIGMPPDAIAQVFEPFVQADSSTTRHYGGTGLGLTVVDRFTRLLGGRVDVESTEGEGTVFHVWLPSNAPVYLTPPSISRSSAPS